MHIRFTRREVALAAIAALSAASSIVVSSPASAQATAGKYVAGDFHNHTTCSDGSVSLPNLIKKATDKSTTPFGLDWFVQAGHGNSGGTRNCTLAEDPSLATPVYPFTNQGPTTTWANSIGIANVKGDNGATTGYMWRWQSVQEYQYPMIEYLSAYKNLPLFMGIEENPWGHEHASASIITGQMPVSLDTAVLPTTPGPLTARYTPLGNANALAQHVYCFDSTLTDTSRGNVTSSAVGNNWDCSNPYSPNSYSTTLGFNNTAKKLLPASGTGAGDRGHLVTVEAVSWMNQFHANTSYYVPAHLERAGPFNPNGNNGWNVEHLRDFNNAAPAVAFGMETQPGHGAANNRGEYQVLRNNFGGSVGQVDSAGGTTYGGTGVYGAQIGGVWDSMLGEGRNFWFFASSDWHNRGIFSTDDRRTTQDFYPGEYQRNYTLVRNGSDKLRPQTIVDGLRSGNNWAASGQLIDRLAFVVCSGYSAAQVQAFAVAAASNSTAIDGVAGCANMGEKLVVPSNASLIVGIAVRDPAGPNNSPYTFPNPSLMQSGINQPMNQPVLDHVDLIGGLVTGFRTPSAPDYAGEWPRNTAWLKADGTTPVDPVSGLGYPAGMAVVPAAAKNTTAAVLSSFKGGSWNPVTIDGAPGVAMTYTVTASASRYFRLRGTNMPPAVPFETDINGNPLADVYTNGSDATRLRIPCTTVGSNVPPLGGRKPYTGTAIDGCPSHLAVATAPSPIAGQKAVSYDVAAWADLWFYSNPIYVQVMGSSVVAGVTTEVRPANQRNATKQIVKAKPRGHYTVAVAPTFVK